MTTTQHTGVPIGTRTFDEPDLEHDQDDVEPEQVDLLSLLTIDELNSGSRLLKASLVIAITEKTENYERALAVLAFLHARRDDPKAKVAPFFARSFTDISDQLQDIAREHRKEAADPLAPKTS